MREEDLDLPGFDALIEAVRTHTPDELSSFLVRAAQLLTRYENAPPGGKRRPVYHDDLLRHLAPLDPPPRLQPRELLRRLLGLLEIEIPTQLHVALLQRVDRSTHADSWRDLEALTSVLADSEVSIGEAFAFRVVAKADWLARDPTPLQRASRDLVILAGRSNGTSALSMLDRLRHRDAITSSALHAALRSVASFAPSWFDQAMQSYIALLSGVANPQDPAELRPLFRDLARRAGPTTLLTTLGRFAPEEHPVIWRGAFGGERQAPFRLAMLFGAEDADQKMAIQTDDELVDLHWLGALGEDADGPLRIRNVTGEPYLTRPLTPQPKRGDIPSWFAEKGLLPSRLEPASPSRALAATSRRGAGAVETISEMFNRKFLRPAMGTS